MAAFATLALAARSDGVVQLTMARPAVHNAFDETMIGELDAAFTQLEADASVRVIVLAGEGRHFSAGADLQWMQRASQADEAWNRADARRFAAMLARIAQCAKPTVARVQGAALGGGVGLVCACDLAVASEDASFAVSEVRFGILPAVIGPVLVNAVGRRAALSLALTGTRIPASRALALGLVHEVVPALRLDEAVEKMVESLQAGGPAAQAELKRLYARLRPGDLDPETRELTAATIARVRAGAEAREGFDAFLAKRPAAWIAPR